MFKSFFFACFFILLPTHSEHSIKLINENGFTSPISYLEGHNYSVMGWIKLPEATSDNDCLFALGESDGYKSAFSLYHNSSNNLGFTFFVGDRVLWKEAQFYPTSWNHFAATYNSEAKRTDLYINGTYTLSSTQPQFPEKVSPENFRFCLGVNLDGAKGIKASYDDWSVWTGSLTPVQVEDNYNFGKGRKLSGEEKHLSAYFDFDTADRFIAKTNEEKKKSFKLAKQRKPQKIISKITVTDDRFSWTATNEAMISKYMVIESDTATIIESIQAGAGSYSVKINESKKYELIVVGWSGYQSIFRPAD